MNNEAFVADDFDNLKTLHRKERTLLGDLRVAFHDHNLNEFTKLLHQTGYKNDLQIDKVNITTNIWSRLKLQKFKTSRNILFTQDDNRESLFEDILKRQGAGNSKFISLVWTECELWRKRDILVTTNSKGKLPIDYIIESNDDENLFAFLVFDFDSESDTVSKASKNYFLKLKNFQFTQQTNQNLFQKFYSIIDDECEEIIYNIMNKLLKEMGHIIDIKSETAIDDVLKMENEDYKHKILKILMTYWKVYSKEYNHYKTILSELSPYYKLLLTLKERHEYEFEDQFPVYLEKLKEKHGEEAYEEHVRDDCNSLLEFALNNSQRRAINIIINCPLIDANKVRIKSNDSSTYDSQIVHHIMSKLLERGFYLGNMDEGNHVPIDWISAKVFEDFLDSRVNEDGIHGVQIDYNFLIDPKTREEKIKGDHDDNGRLLFSRSMQSLENILDNNRLKPLITHPVLSTFINLKCIKFRRIFNLNFFIFLFLYMIPFMMLLTLIPFRKFYIDIFETFGVETLSVKKKKIYKIFGLTLSQFLNWPYRICIVTTIYITIREMLQLFVICESFKEYFKKKSNQFEVSIIILSWYVLWGIKAYSLAEIKTYLTIPSAFIIMFATIDLLIILPYPSMSIYMIMLEQVTRTFLKFFTIFFVIIVAFTFTFCVAFHSPALKKSSFRSPWQILKVEWSNETKYSSNTFGEFREPAIAFLDTMDDVFSSNDTIFRNFENPFTSFQKTIMMLSGEYTIDPYTLNTASKQFLFLVFVFSSFILFNLINGLAISDIAQLKEHAEFLNLKHQVRNGAESESVVCDIYWKVRRQSSKDNWWRESVLYIMSLFIRKYPYLHKMDNLCIDFKQKTVKYELDQRRTNILRTIHGDAGKYTLDMEILKKLRGIVEAKQNREEDVNEKVENLQAEVKKLKTTLRMQHEEMKKFIQECLQPQEKKS